MSLDRRLGRLETQQRAYPTGRRRSPPAVAALLASLSDAELTEFEAVAAKADAAARAGRPAMLTPEEAAALARLNAAYACGDRAGTGPVP